MSFHARPSPSSRPPKGSSAAYRQPLRENYGGAVRGYAIRGASRLDPASVRAFA